MATTTVNTKNKNFYGTYEAHYPAPIAVVSGQH